MVEVSGGLIIVANMKNNTWYFFSKLKVVTKK